MMPCSCAASRASAICFAIGSASATGIAPRRDSLCQILAFDEFHHEGTNPAGLFEAVDVRDIGMVERSERLRLAREPRQAIGVARERVREDLQRDVAIELRVAGAVDLSHAAFADQRGDFVVIRSDP